MDTTTAALIGLIALALLFDFTNGFHDSANAIATVVATHVLRPESPWRGRRCSTSTEPNPDRVRAVAKEIRQPR